MIDVSELLTDPDFAQPFQIQRFTGGFANEGEYSRAATTINATGVIQPATADDMVDMLPEGERTNEGIRVWCKTALQMADGQGQESDVIVWGAKLYRVMRTKPWQPHGYHFVIAVGLNNA